MKASRLIFTLLLVSSVALIQLAGQQTKADQKPIEEVKAKAEAGDAESQVELGLRYVKGEGVTKDQVEAVKWFRKAAEQNYARAQYNLGLGYYNGEGVAKDPVEAVKWFRKAADQNDADAQRALGVCYEEGEGVTQDRAEARKWYRKAADQNNADAQNSLAAIAGTEAVMATIEGKDGYTLSGHTECGGEATFEATIKPGERFIASCGEKDCDVYLKSGISGTLLRNRIRLLPGEPLAKLNYESCKKEWRKLQSKPIKKTDDVADSAKKYHGVANYYKLLVQASEGDAKAFGRLSSLLMDGEAGDENDLNLHWPLLHVAGDDTFAKLLAGQPPGFREGYAAEFSEPFLPILNPKPYLKLHFPKTYALLYGR